MNAFITTKKIVFNRTFNKGYSEKKNFACFSKFFLQTIFESFQYYIKNIVNNKEAQVVLKESYNNYMSNPGLGIIKDNSREVVIKTKDEKIEFNLKKDEFNEVKDFLNGIEIDIMQFDIMR